VMTGLLVVRTNRWGCSCCPGALSPCFTLFLFTDLFFESFLLYSPGSDLTRKPLFQENPLRSCIFFMVNSPTVAYIGCGKFPVEVYMDFGTVFSFA